MEGVGLFTVLIELLVDSLEILAGEFENEPCLWVSPSPLCVCVCVCVCVLQY